VRSLAAEASVALVPAVSAFVGGDVVAGLVALGAGEASAPTLLVDIGTNAEVAVVGDGTLTVASAPAGPAFEGAGLSCGGIAVSGAVSRVSVDGGEFRLEVIGDEPAAWLSGAGVISAVAALRRAGHLSADGALLAEGPLAACFDVDESGVLGVRLTDSEGGIRMTQLDVRAFQLAKAAVAVAISQALVSAGVRAADVGTFWIAGAFGQAVEVRDLVDVGVIPASVAGRARFAGNTALQGAATLAMNPGALDGVQALLESARTVELAADAAFGARLIEALTLAPYDL